MAWQPDQPYNQLPALPPAKASTETLDVLKAGIPTRAALAELKQAGELTEQLRKDNPELISGENSAKALLERIKAERAAAAPIKKPRKTAKKKAAANGA